MHRSIARYRFNFLIFIGCLIAGIVFSSVRLELSKKSGPRNASTEQTTSHEYYDFLTVPKPAEPMPPIAEPTPIPAGEVRKTYCLDSRIRPIWNLIRRDPDVREALTYVWSRFDSPNCKEMFELKYIDLDLDGWKEVLVRSRTFTLCGAAGNCDFWVIKQERDGRRVLLYAKDYVGSTAMGKQVIKARTNGYADLLLKGNGSISETTYSTYKFNGRKYVEGKCVYEFPNYHDPRYSEDKPTWQRVPCREFYRGLNKH